MHATINTTRQQRAETDPRIGTQLLELAQQREHVAKTYEILASLERFFDRPTEGHATDRDRVADQK